MEPARDYGKYMFMVMLVFVIYISYLVIRPFLTAIVTSAILAYIFYPFYERIHLKLKRKNLSALIASILIILLLAVPFLFFLNSLTKESQFVYIKAKQIFTTGDVLSLGCEPGSNATLCRMSSWVGEFITTPGIRYHIEDSLKKTTSALAQRTSDIVFSIPTILLNIFVTFFTTFYLFRDGKEVTERIKKLMPLKVHHQKQVVQQLDETMYAIIYGSLLIAAIQGAIGALGFYIFGVSSPVAWGVLMAILALVPFIGTAIVWLPVSLVMIVQGISTDSTSISLRGLGLLVYCAFFVSTTDNFLRPYLISKRAKIHPVLVLLGVLGGLALFGFMGFIIGPLVLAVFITLLDIYEKERFAGNGLKE